MSLLELRAASPSSGPPGGPLDHAAVEPGRRARSGTPWWGLAAIAILAACALAGVIGTALVSGDGVWHLVWGRALAHGDLESFATGPTPHPALVVLGAATSVLGDEGSYLVTYALFGPLSFGVLAAAVFEVSRRLSSSWAGAVAVLIMATSAGMLALAGAAQYDIAFAALVLSAVALAMAQERRWAPPLACLALAGFIRPEAWVLAGAYWLWLAPSLSWPARAHAGAVVAAAPLLWLAMDVLVMGDPLYSLHVTDDGSDALYRRFTVRENLVAAWHSLEWYLGVVPLLLLAPAALLLGWDRPRSALPLLVTLAITLGIFLVLLSQGMASSERYLLVPACVLAVLVAVAVDGRGRRTPRRIGLGAMLGLLVLLGAADRTGIYGTARDGAAAAHERVRDVRELVAMPGVREALTSCPVVSFPDGKPRYSFAFYAGRAPEELVSDGARDARPDIFVAPGSHDVAKAVLTRKRFDEDASFRVPPGLRPGPRTTSWALYVSPTSACTSALR